MAVPLMRAIILAHRYLGIAVGVVMVTWCASGIVMMYVPYPQITESERVEHLAPIDWSGCCVVPEDGRTDTQADRVADSGAPTRLQIEMLGDRPLLRLALAHRKTRLIDLTDGGAVASISAAQAATVAARYGPDPQLLDVIDHDQWTVQGADGPDRPLFHYRLNDPAATEVYVSSVTGHALQVTTSRQRFWNWLGSIPHWIYFTGLRQHPDAWAQVVIWTSTVGVFLTLTGICVGVYRFKRGANGRWLPYRGFHYWHHVLGLWFGVFLLTWVASGLVSMNPWGFLDGDPGTAPRPGGPNLHRLQQSLQALADSEPAQGALSIDSALGHATGHNSAPGNNQLFLVATQPGGTRVRLDEIGSPAPLSAADLASLGRNLAHNTPISSAQMMDEEDRYYFSHHRELALLPVYRVVLDDPQRTRYYLDPVSGELRTKIDQDGRWYRWLHQGAHRIDFSAAVRASPIREVAMITVLVGMTLLSAAGTYLGVRRLTR